MKTKVSLLFALLLSVISVAQTFNINGIEYQFISETAVAVLGRASGNGSSNITIPATVEANGQTLSVRQIADSAFEGDGLVSVTIEGNRLRFIERDAFRNNNLNSIHLPSTVLEINQDAFRDNVNLMDVTLGNELTTLGPGAFRNADVRDITLPATMSDIANAVFRDNTGLRSITALGTTPANINTSGIDNDSFRDRSVISLTVPEGAEAAYANNDWTGFFSVNGQYTGPTGGTFTAINGFTYRFLSGNPNRVSITDNSNTGAIVIGPVLQTGGVFFDVVELEQDAFRGNNITSVTLPNTLITIGRGAFFQNQITSVTIPDSVIEVGQDAFRDNVTLTDVTLGNSVAILGAGAFRNAAILEITLPASITTIENGVFRDNDTLRVIDALGTTPATVVTGGGDTDSFGNRSVIGLTVPVDSVALYNASGWEGFFSVNGVFGGQLGDEFINNNITYKVTARGLPNTAHIVNNTNTGVLNIPGLVTQSSADFNIVEIEVDAFRDNDLTSVTIPDSVVHIRTDAFRDNAALTNVTLGDSVATLGPGAFRNADIEEITLPATMTDIENAVFRDNTGLRRITALGTTPANINTSGIDNDSFRDRSVISLTVPEGAEAAYANNDWTGFFSVNGQYTGPTGGTITATNGFTYRFLSGNPNRVSITDNSNTGAIVIGPVLQTGGVFFDVVELEQDAFRGNNITSVTLPNTLITIGRGAFFQNQITSVTIPNSVVIVGQDAFRDNQLTAVTLGNSVTTLRAGAFRNNDIEEITLPASMTTIENGVFRDNQNLIKVTAQGITPASLVTSSNVDDDSFRDRSQIDLFVPEGTEQAYLDAGWIGFASVTEFAIVVNGLNYRVTSEIPAEVEVIGGTSIPTNLVLPDIIDASGLGVYTLVSVGFRAFDAEGLDSVILPNTLRNIGDFAFENNGMPSVEIPEGVEIISFRSFRGNTLTTITIPSTVTSIAQDAFANNPLQTVTSLGTIPASIETLTFGDRSGIDLFIPEGTEQAYLDAGWTGFNSINEIDNIIPTPYLEDFETFTTSVNPFVAENGWSAIDSDQYNWEAAPATDTGSPITGPGPSINTGNYFYTEASNGNNGDTTDLISPLVNLSNLTAPSLTFNYHMFGSAIGTLEVLVNGTDTVFSLSGQQQISDISPWAIAEINLSAYVGQTISVTFRGTRGNDFRGDIAIDNVVFDELPSCLQPSNLDANNITVEQADLSWTENGTATLWDIELLDITAGETETGTPTTTGLSIPSFLATGLTQGNDYAFFVRANCGGGDVSNWAGPFNFITPIQSCDTLFLDSGGSTENYSSSEFSSTTYIPETTGQAISITFTYVDLEVDILGMGTQDGCFDFLTIYNGPDNTFPVLAQTLCGEESGNGDVPSVASSLLSIGDTFTSTDPSGALTIEFRSDGIFVRTGWEASVSCVDLNAVVSIAPKVFLQGASLNPIAGEDNLMRDDLRVAGLIPAISPYLDEATIPTNGGMDGADNPDPENDCVDWVFVELRDANDNTSIVASQSALLQRDGDVVAVDGSPLSFNASAGDYFVVIKHRNHLGVMTANTIALSSTTTTVDFTDANNPITFGSNAQTTFGMPTGVLGLWAGNINGDGIVQFSGATPDASAILSNVLNDVGNLFNFSTFPIEGYTINDVNMNGSGQYEGGSADAPLILQNVLAHPDNSFLNFSTFQIVEQLPANAARMSKQNQFNTKLKTQIKF